MKKKKRRPYTQSHEPLSPAERVGYHRAWLKRMRRKIGSAIKMLELERAAHARSVGDLNVALLTMRRMLAIEFRDVKS